MFTELPEEMWPENFSFPAVDTVNLDELRQLAADQTLETVSYMQANLTYVFVDAKHIEFVDLFSRKLVFPMESFYIPLFKSLAKAKGPHVALIQFGFRSLNTGWPYQYAAKKDERFVRRAISPVSTIFGSLANYELRQTLAVRIAKHLGTHRHDADIGVIGTYISGSSFSRVPSVLSYSTDVIHLYIRGEE